MASQSEVGRLWGPVKVGASLGWVRLWKVHQAHEKIVLSTTVWPAARNTAAAIAHCVVFNST